MASAVFGELIGEPSLVLIGEPSLFGMLAKSMP